MKNILINYDAICVLKKKRYTEHLEIDYINIESTLDREFYEIKKMVEDEYYTAKDIIKKIQETKLKNILKGVNYCENYSHPFQEVPDYDIDAKLEKFTEKKSDIENQEIINREKQDLLKDLLFYLKIYNFYETIYFIESNKHHLNIVAYSHKFRGWKNIEYKLNNDFQLSIISNFGYGSSSYFFSIIKYKDINIIPFSEWILYEFARFYEIIRYTRSYLLHDQEWLKVFEFVRDACNLAIDNEEEFVRKYILDECEKMVSGLKNILENNRFIFKDYYSIFYERTFESHDLVDFRGEKITGALDFIKNIIEFDKIIKVKEFIQRIIEYNKIIQPILKNEIILLNEKLAPLKEEISKIEPIYEMHKKQYDDYKQKKEELKKELIEKYGNVYEKYYSNEESFKKENPELEFFDNIYKRRFPEAEDIINKYKLVKIKYDAIYSKIQLLERYRLKIDGYIQKIENYFKENSIV